MMNRRTQAILILVGVFVLGAIAGALGFGVFVRNEVRQAQQLREREGFGEFFADRLRLTQEQRDSLDDELTRTYDDFATLRAAVAEEYGELLDTLDSRIAPRLTEEQRERLRMAEMRFRHGFPNRRARAGFAPIEAPPADSRRDSTRATTPPPKSSTKPPAAATPSAPPASSDSAEAFADTARRSVPGEGLGRLPMNLRTRLQLSDTQFVQVRTIVAETRRQVRSDVEELRGYPRLQIGAAIRRVGEMEQQFTAVLTSEQMTAFAPIRDNLLEKMKSEIWLHRGMMQRGRRGGGPPRGMQRMRQFEQD